MVSAFLLFGAAGAHAEDKVIEAHETDYSGGDVQNKFDAGMGLGVDRMLGIPLYGGFSYRFADFYRMGVDFKLSLIGLLFSAAWMHMFEFLNTEHIALAIGSGVGYLAADKLNLRFDGSYDEDDGKFTGTRGIVFPIAMAFDWHTSKTVSLRLLVDFNNYLVLEDKRYNRRDTTKYEYTYDVILQGVVHF